MPIIIYHTRTGRLRYKIIAPNNELLVHCQPIKSKQSIHKSIAAVAKEITEMVVVDRTKKVKKRKK